MYAGHGKRPVLSRVPTHFRPEAPRSRRKTLCFQYGGCLGRAQICLLTANSGLPFALWTSRAVRELIERRLAKRLGLSTVPLYLRRWGMTPRKPLVRAEER